MYAVREAKRVVRRSAQARSHQQRRTGAARRPNAIRLILFISIVGVMLFALYTLFLWPTLKHVVSHRGDYIIEEEVAEEHSLRLAPISHLRSSDLADNDDAQSGSAARNNKGSPNVVAHRIKEHHAVGSGVAAEYDVPMFPRVPLGSNFPLRAPQGGPIVYGRAGTAWREGDPLRGLVGVDPAHMHGQNNVRPDGSVGWVRKPDLDWSKETVKEKVQRHDHTCFNVRHSDSLHLDRKIPDVRSKKCPHLSLIHI